MPRTYRFELSQRGREELRRRFGEIFAAYIAKELERLGWGTGYYALGLADTLVNIPIHIIDKFEKGLNENGQIMLLRLFDELSISSISVHINGN